MNPLRISLAAATVAGSLMAQTQCPAPNPNTTIGPIDVNAASGFALDLGVQLLNGELFVSGRSGTGTTATSSITVIDPNTGALIRAFPQPAASQPSAFGLRDGATDGTNLFFGNENGIFGFDINGNAVTTINAANGPQAVTFPITGPGLTANGNYRALAFNPNGNGGNGSFYSGDFGDDINEVDLAGNILNTFTNGGGWSAYGLALDGTSLWINDNGPGGLAELDTTTGLLTGNVLSAGVAVPGGMSLGANNDLVYLDQATPDVVIGTLITPIFGNDPLNMLTGADGALANGNSVVNVLATSLDWDFDAPAGTAYAYILNVAPESAVCGSVFNGGALTGLEGPFAGLSNFESVTNFTNPASAIFLLEPAIAGTPVSVPASAALGTLPDGLVRVQGIYLEVANDPTVIPVRSSNPSYLTLNSSPIIGVTVSANGANSFNSVTTSGYFQIVNASTDPNKAITKVVMDYSVNLPALVFDTDQTGMNDLLEGGNSALTTCEGTYRNGSDVATGLVFDASNTVPATPCDAAALTGFIGTNETVVASYNTLEFNFAGGTFLNGAVFEFDADTDGGGTGGDDNAGMVVTITFADGTTTTGIMAAAGPDLGSVTL